jgi:hypothetical protein
MGLVGFGAKMYPIWSFIEERNKMSLSDEKDPMMQYLLMYFVKDKIATELSLLNEHLEVSNNLLNKHLNKQDEIIDRETHLNANMNTEEEILSWDPKWEAEHDFFDRYGIRYPQVLFSGFIVSTYSLIERGLLGICEILDLEIVIKATKRERIETGIYRAKKFLEAINYKIKETSWLEIKNLGKLRNQLAHKGHGVNTKCDEILLEAEGVEKYTYKIDNGLKDYLLKNKILILGSIIPSYKYCKHLLEFSDNFFDDLYNDLQKTI